MPSKDEPPADGARLSRPARAHWPPAVWALLLGIGLVLGWAVAQGWGADPYAPEVMGLLEQLQGANYGILDNAPERELLALGPKAYPELARIISGRAWRFERYYARFVAGLPAEWRRPLLRPQFIRNLRAHQLLRQRAAQAVRSLGPLAARPLAGAIAQGLEDSDPVGAQYLLDSLCWALPESSAAVAALGKWLAPPDPERMLFGLKEADEIWPRVPQFAPRLVA